MKFIPGFHPAGMLRMSNFAFLASLTVHPCTIPVPDKIGESTHSHRFIHSFEIDSGDGDMNVIFRSLYVLLS